MPVGYTVVKQWQGVNLSDDPRSIADNELLWAANCYPNVKGIIAPRARQCPIDYGGTGGAQPVDNGLAATICDFVDRNGKQWYLVYDPMGSPGSTVFTLHDSNLINRKNVDRPDSVSSLFPVVPYGVRPGHLVYNNELFVFPGHSFSGLVLGADDLSNGQVGGAKFRELGTTWADFAGASADRPKFSFGEIYRDTFVLGGLPPPYESLVFFTQGVDSAGNPQPSWYTLLSAAKAAGFGYGDGDKLINFKTTPVTGGSSAIEPYGIALKRRSVWMLQGDVPTTTDNGTLVVTPIMRGEGLISSHAVCVTPYGIIWCSGRNVWLMPPGQKAIAIGDKIKGYLSQLPQTDSPAWYLSFCNDVLYLNCPSSRVGTAGDQIYSRFTGEGAAAAPITYAATEQWWCDLRNLDEPRWWGPQDVKASHMVSMIGQQGPLVMGGITPYLISGFPVRAAFTLGESNPTLRSFTIGAGALARSGTGVTATIGAHTLRIGDSVSLTLTGGDVAQFQANGIVITGRAATTISWVEDLIDPGWFTPNSNVNPVTIESTVDRGIDLYDVGITAGEAGVNPTTHQLVRTREMDFGDPMLTKILECVEVNSAWSPELHAGSSGASPWLANSIKDGGVDSSVLNNELQTARGLTALADSSTPGVSQTGFALDLGRLGSGSPGNGATLFDRFMATPVYPRNSTRFLFRTLTFEVYSVLDGPPSGGVFPGDYIRRRWALQSLGFRVRPIGRRPGGAIT